MEYVFVNGVVTKKSEADISTLFWDNPLVISQKIWFGYGGIPLLQENILSLQEQLATLGIKLPHVFNNHRELFRLCKRMLNKNKFFRSGHLNIQIFASENKTNSLITAKNADNFDFPISQEGSLIAFSEYRKHSGSSLQRLACHNRGIWEAAKNEIKNAPFNTSVLLNEKGYICEGIASNIFILKDNILLTPSPETGCYTDIIKDVIFSLSDQLKLKLVQSDEIPKEILSVADEVFLGSEAEGIRWILGLNNKRYIRSFSLELHEKINDFLKNKTAP